MALMIPPTISTTKYVTLTQCIHPSFGCHHFLINASIKSHGSIKILKQQFLLLGSGSSSADKTAGTFTPTLLVSMYATSLPMPLDCSCGILHVRPWYRDVFERPLVEPWWEGIGWTILSGRGGKGCFHTGCNLGAPGSECAYRMFMTASNEESEGKKNQLSEKAPNRNANLPMQISRVNTNLPANLCKQCDNHYKPNSKI